jgi:UDP-hydrolysing UDP-N-acetyl-D-glucosamine 2-epimerase
MAIVKKNVAVFTGNRAEYGLQVPLLRAIEKHDQLDYKLLVSGAHLDAGFGMSLSEIESDGFEVYAEIEIEMDANSLYSTAQAIGSGILSISKVLAELKPDVMVVYADRFEGFAAVIAATQMNIPTVHIEGGDLTEGGALDDSVRHAMTKLSHIHMTTNAQASNRILAMGEEAWRVHNVGFPTIDLILEGNYANWEQINGKFSLDRDRPIVVFTQHSVSTEVDAAKSQILPSLEAIEKLADMGVQFIITYPNNDAGGKQITDELNKFCAQLCNPNIQLHPSIGRFMYHGILALSKCESNRVACMGNSSSGIKETPAFGCPTLNIGTRQNGRLRGANVLSTNYDAQEIYTGVKKCLFDEAFRQICRGTNNPYGLGGAGAKIANIIADTDFDRNLTLKKMTLRGEVVGNWYR